MFVLAIILRIILASNNQALKLLASFMKFFSKKHFNQFNKIEINLLKKWLFC